jgi:sigma-B regulation protein RsbU (phosphoserine phosphatase)
MHFSLKWKIILALTLVPMISLAIFLFVTYTSFKSDRLAYVYESSLAQSRLLTKYATESISSIHALLQQWSYMYKKDPAATNETINTFIQSSLVFTYIKEIDFIAYNTKDKKVIEKHTMIASSPSSELQNYFNQIDILIERYDKQGKSIFLQINNLDSWVMFSSFKTDLDERILVFTTMNNNWIRSKFPGQIVSESFWINDEGKVITSDSSLNANNIDIVSKQVLNTKSSSGSFLFNVGNVGYIAAFNFTNNFAILPIIIIKTSAAYEAVNILLEKSFIVLTLIISIAILIGLFLGKKLTVSLEYLLRATQSISRGNFEIKLKLRSNDEIGILAKSFNTMTTEIQSLLQQNKEVGRMEAELNLAKTVQDEIQPKTSFQSPYIQLEGYSQAASECSGDWWNYFENETDFFLILGDATGHGASAALFTSAVNSLIILLRNIAIENPKECLNLMNNALYQTAKGKKSITLSFLKINKVSGKVVYTNASHEFPYLFRKVNEKTKIKDIDCLNSNPSQPLGFLLNSMYENHEFQLEKNDIIVLYTDGISECRNSEGEMWGDRKFLGAMLESIRTEPKLNHSLKSFINKFATYTNKAPLADDATIVLLKFNP